jgi:hypothetical protein
MSLKQLFYAAFTARVISWLALALAFFSLFADLELRTAVLSLAVSHLAWILGTMFLGVFREHMAEVAADLLQNMVEESVVPEEVEPVESVSHPIFDEEETND